MPYTSNIPVDTNAVRGVSGDLVLMETNFAILASVVSGMTAPSESAAMSQLVVTSGASNFGIGWSTTKGALLFSDVVRATLDASAFTLTGVVLAGDTAPTADTHYVRRTEVKTETLGGHIVTVASGSVFALEERAMYAYTIDELHAQTASGEVDVTVKIGGVAVSGLDAVTISGTQRSDTATDAFTVTSGARVTLLLDAVTGSPSDLSFTIKSTRS